MKIQRILLATDFSSTAHNALLYALDMAKELKAEVVIAHACQSPTPDFSPYSVNSSQDLYPEKYLKRAEQKMEVLKSDFLYAPKVPYECIIMPGVASEIINNLAREKEADLVIMGTRRAEGAKTWFGSVTTHTVKHSDHPVLVIPQDARFVAPKKIVLTAYHVMVQHIEVLGVLKSMLDLYGASLEVLHLHAREEDDTCDRKKLQDNLKDFFGRDINFVYSEYEPVNEGIQLYLDESGADMLAMLPLKHGLLDQLIHSSKTEYMIFHTIVPLLALR